LQQLIDLNQANKGKMAEKTKVYAVDLDGTLAHSYEGEFDKNKIGKPVSLMRKLVRQWMRKGHEVRIFTARAANPKNIPPIKEWLKEHGMEGLEVTNKKTPDITTFYDDRAVRVERDTGKLASLSDHYKAAELTYSPENGLILDVDDMYGNPTANRALDIKRFNDLSPNQFTVDSHGGSGYTNGRGGAVENMFSGHKENESLRFIERPSDRFGPARSDVIYSPSRLAPMQFNPEAIKNRPGIDQVLSLACNRQGTCTPQVFERMLGHPLKRVSMVPPGHYGSGGSSLSNYVTAAMHSVFGIKDTAPIHNYVKENGQWGDTGLYKTKIDRRIDVAHQAVSPVTSVILNPSGSFNNVAHMVNSVLPKRMQIPDMKPSATPLVEPKTSLPAPDRGASYRQIMNAPKSASLLNSAPARFVAVGAGILGMRALKELPDPYADIATSTAFAGLGGWTGYEVGKMVQHFRHLKEMNAAEKEHQEKQGKLASLLDHYKVGEDREKKKKNKSTASIFRDTLPWVAGASLAGAGASEAVRRGIFTPELQDDMSDFTRKRELDKIFKPYAALPKDEQAVQGIVDYAIQGNRLLNKRMLWGALSPTELIKSVRSAPWLAEKDRWTPNSQQHYDAFESGALPGVVRVLGEISHGWDKADGSGSLPPSSNSVREALRHSVNDLSGINYVDTSGGHPASKTDREWLFPAVGMASQLSPEKQMQVMRSLGPKLKQEIVSSGPDGEKQWGNLIDGLQNAREVVYGGYGKLTSALQKANELWGTTNTGLAATGLTALGGYGAWKFLDSLAKKKKERARQEVTEKTAKAPSYLSILRDRFSEARKDVHPSPTEAQKSKGNYPMAHVWMQGLDITIETPKGGVRSGTNKEGKSWKVVLKNDYGYIRNHKRSQADGDHVDVFVGPYPASEIVYVVDQNVGGKFDEHKCMCGFFTEKEAKDAYLANFDENWKGFRSITALTMRQFKKWLEDGDTSSPLAGQKYSDFLKTANEMDPHPILSSITHHYLNNNPAIATAVGAIKGGLVGAAIHSLRATKKEILDERKKIPTWGDDIGNGLLIGSGTGLATWAIPHAMEAYYGSKQGHIMDTVFAPINAPVSVAPFLGAGYGAIAGGAKGLFNKVKKKLTGETEERYELGDSIIDGAVNGSQQALVGSVSLSQDQAARRAMKMAPPAPRKINNRQPLIGNKTHLR
jgi:hypothetical protein